MGVQTSVAGSYILPELTGGQVGHSSPPQISMAVPVQTAEWCARLNGAPIVDTLLQVSVDGSYRTPPFPQTIISWPVHTAVCPDALGLEMLDTGIQESFSGSYRPRPPPHT